MPSGPRIRTDNVFGTLTDNPLTNVATTMNSAGLANLAAVSSAHAVIILDPLRTAGAPEIVIVTAHTASATSATITRGAYGTAARQHAQGTLWVHAPTREDFLQILTSGTRPSDPFQGQLIYETDTDSYVGRSAAAAWQTVVPLGAWTAWTPTFTNFTLGNGVLSANFQRVGRMINWRLGVTLGTTSAMGSNPQFTLPANAAAALGVDYPIGDGALKDASAGADWRSQIWIVSATTARIIWYNATPNAAQVTATAPFTWTTPDTFRAMGTYEAAT